MNSKLLRVIYVVAAMATLAIVQAADNGVAAPKWDTNKPGSVKWRTTDASGVHTPHVIVTSGAITSTPASTQRTPTITNVTADATIAAGARKLTLIFSADFSGTVLGVAFAGANDSSVTIDAPNGDTLAAVAITVSAGGVRVVKVQ